MIASGTGVELEPNPIEPDWVHDGSPQARSRLLSRSADGLAMTMEWDCTAGEFEWALRHRRDDLSARRLGADRRRPFAAAPLRAGRRDLFPAGHGRPLAGRLVCAEGGVLAPAGAEGGRSRS